MLKPSYYNHVFSDETGNIILFNARTLATVGLDKNLHTDLLDILENPNKAVNTALQDSLYENSFLLPIDFDEKQSIRTHMMDARYNKEYCSLTIAPTLGCNFNCYYCFEDESVRSKFEYMSNEVQDGIADLIKHHFEMNGTKTFGVCWFGGEPLLAIDVISRLSAKMIAICQTYGVNYSASIITNGYKLTEPVAQRLKECKVDSAQITIDGPAHIHDNRRVLKGGAGSFKRIIDNIKISSKHIDIGVRINVDKQNYNYLDELISELSVLLDPEKISVATAPVVAQPHTPPELSVALDPKKYHEVQKAFVKEAFKKGLEAISPPTIVANACSADQFYSYMIGPQGEFYQCWNDFGDENLVIGSLSEGKIKCINYVQSYFDFDPTQNQKCGHCTVMPLCMGGCPKERMKHDNVPQCGIYKYNLKESVVNNLIKNRNIKNDKNIIFSQDMQSIKIQSRPHYFEVFHTPTPNNFVYLLIPKYYNKEQYHEQIKNAMQSLNLIDLEMLKQCHKLIGNNKCSDLFGWAKGISDKRNLGGIYYAQKVTQYIEKEIINESFINFIKRNNASLLEKAVNVTDYCLKLIRINVYINPIHVNEALDMLIAEMKTGSSKFVDCIERIEIAKENTQVMNQEKSYPTIIIYLHDKLGFNDIVTDHILFLVEKLNKLFDKFSCKEINDEFSYCYTQHITVTQGYRLYKKYLTLLGIIDQLYSKESNYAFCLNSSLHSLMDHKKLAPYYDEVG